MSKGQIFIGGTGRSGTTIMGEVLGTHPKIHTYRRELRFITDPDGLATLCNALTTNYSPPQARAAVARFSEFMLEQLTDPLRRPYLGFDFRHIFGPNYEQLVESFIDRIASKPCKTGDYHLAGGPVENVVAPAARLIERIANTKRRPQWAAPFFPKNRLFLSPRNVTRDGHYFVKRSKLCGLIGEFTDRLLSEGMARTEKEIWCEQTPVNAMHAGFIHEILPDNCFILARRDPRGVFASFLNQRWSPDDPRQSILFLQNVYARWEEQKRILDARGAKYIIVRIEDLANDPTNELGKIADFIGVSADFPGQEMLDASKLDSWRKSMKKDVLGLAEESLASEIEAHGYAT